MEPIHLMKAFNACELEYKISRYNGGWNKTVTGIDKSKDNGYSLIGEFVKSEQLSNQKPGLFVDCDIQGSRKNQSKKYQLFSLKEDGTAEFLFYSEGADWAVKMWATIESYLDKQKTPDKRKEEIQEEIEFLENRIAQLKEELNERE